MVISALQITTGGLVFQYFLELNSPGERMHLYQKADQILVEAAAIMPLTYGRQHWLVKPWVRKFLTPAMYTSCFWKDVIIEAH
jgi:ABC-type oligopeptide transport system substrate-binding subunit